MIIEGLEGDKYKCTLVSPLCPLTSLWVLPIFLWQEMLNLKGLLRSARTQRMVRIRIEIDRIRIEIDRIRIEIDRIWIEIDRIRIPPTRNLLDLDPDIVSFNIWFMNDWGIIDLV